MIGTWRDFLIDHLAEWRLPTGGNWSFVLHNNYYPHMTTLNILWFRNGSVFPDVVVKFTNQAAPMEKEHRNMQRAYACAPAIVPRPLYFGQQGRLWGLWMEGVPGLMLQADRDCSPALLRSLVDTICSFHGAARRTPAVPDSTRYRRMVEAPLATLAQFGASTAGCARVASSASPDWLQSLPVIPQHGDLYPGNILMHHNRCHLIDWESFGATDLPFVDLFILLSSYLLGSGHPATVKVIPSLVRGYAERMNLTPHDLSLLLPLAFANWFHLQFEDGRKKFVSNLYPTIQGYFDSSGPWNQAFLS